jgi:hypothetical protein
LLHALHTQRVNELLDFSSAVKYIFFTAPLLQPFPIELQPEMVVPEFLIPPGWPGRHIPHAYPEFMPELPGSKNMQTFAFFLRMPCRRLRRFEDNHSIRQ